MRRLRFVIWIAALLLNLVPEAPLRAECMGRTELATYLKKQDPDCKNLLVLAFDHQSQIWLAGLWKEDKDKKCTLDEEGVAANLALDVNRKPRLSVGGDDGLLVAVYNTNPMLFLVDPGKTEEANIETLAQFEQLARLLGGITQGAIAQADRFTAQREAALEAPEAQASDMWKKVERAITPKIAARAAALRRAQSAQGKVGENARDLEAVTHSVRAYLRGIETGTGVDRLIRDLRCLPGLAGKIDVAARNLAEVEIPSPECKTSYGAANSALARKLNGFSQGRAEEEVAFLTNLRLLGEERTGEDNCSEADQDALEVLREFLDQNRPENAGNALPPEQDRELKNIKSFIVEYLDLLARLDQLSAVSAELLTKAPAAAKSAQSLETLRPREATALGEPLSPAQGDERCTVGDTDARRTQELCALSAGVLPVFSGDPRVKALKFQKRKFSVKAAAPLAADIEKRHKDLESVEFELDSSFINDFSFGIGVLYTDLANPSWTAVKNSAVADPNMVIQRKDEETRAGKPVLLMSFVPQQKDRFLRWGVDLGAAVDANTPTGLAGLSMSLGRFVRLGGGWAWSRVKDLNGQKEFRRLEDGTVDPRSTVPNADAIRTRDVFKNDWYLSLTFSMDALPFFRPAS